MYKSGTVYDKENNCNIPGTQRKYDFNLLDFV